MLRRRRQTHVTGWLRNVYLKKEMFEQQDRHCAYNVTLRRVRATIVAVEKQ